MAHCVAQTRTHFHLASPPISGFGDSRRRRELRYPVPSIYSRIQTVISIYRNTVQISDYRYSLSRVTLRFLQLTLYTVHTKLILITIRRRRVCVSDRIYSRVYSTARGHTTCHIDIGHVRPMSVVAGGVEGGVDRAADAGRESRYDIVQYI